MYISISPVLVQYVCHIHQGQDLPLQYWSRWWRWEADSSWLAPSTCCACPPAASTWRRTPGTSRSIPSSCCHRAGPLRFVTPGRRGRRGTAPAARGRCPPSLLQSYGGERGGMSDGWQRSAHPWLWSDGFILLAPLSQLTLLLRYPIGWIKNISFILLSRNSCVIQVCLHSTHPFHINQGIKHLTHVTNIS